jgi:hypothetical protein
VIELCAEQLEIRPELIMPRLRIAWHRTRIDGGGDPEGELDRCLAAAIGDAQVDARLFRQFLRNIQQSPDASRHHDRLATLLEVVEAAPTSSLADDARSVSRARIMLALGARDRFLASVERCAPTTETSGAMRPLVRRLIDVAGRWGSVDHPDHRAPKVFVIGLSRTGTSSMDTALGMLGFSHLHWLNDLTMDLIRPADLFLFDAFSDVGVVADFEGLERRFPNAKFVMTTRPLESWEVSVERHFSRNAGAVSPSGLIDSQLARTFRGMKGMIESAVYGHHETWADAYLAHERRVAEYFSGSRSDRLLRFDATAGDGWASLCRFLDRPVPDAPYPHLNHGKPLGESAGHR